MDSVYIIYDTRNFKRRKLRTACEQDIVAVVSDSLQLIQFFQLHEEEYPRTDKEKSYEDILNGIRNGDITDDCISNEFENVMIRDVLVDYDLSFEPAMHGISIDNLMEKNNIRRVIVR